MCLIQDLTRLPVSSDTRRVIQRRAELEVIVADLVPFPKIIRIRLFQVVTNRCRQFWLTNSALVYEPKCGGEGGGCGVSVNEYSSAPRRRAQINFGDLTLYLTYGLFTLWCWYASVPENSVNLFIWYGTKYLLFQISTFSSNTATKHRLCHYH